MLLGSSRSTELSFKRRQLLKNLANGTLKVIKESEKTGVKQVPDNIMLLPAVNSKKLVSQESFLINH